jgi:antitoxin component of MazEF toxin-antitoxin module
MAGRSFSMHTRILRVGSTLSVEIPEEIAAQAALKAGDAVEWVSNGTEGMHW